MTRLRRRRAAQARRRNRALLLVSLAGSTLAAVGFFAAGLVLPGLLSTIAGLATVLAAGRHARPANWTPEGRDHESR
jgi:UPF0716 family protein affecting phage T7 exclusion